MLNNGVPTVRMLLINKKEFGAITGYGKSLVSDRQLFLQKHIQLDLPQCVLSEKYVFSERKF